MNIINRSIPLQKQDTLSSFLRIFFISELVSLTTPSTDSDKSIIFSDKRLHLNNVLSNGETSYNDDECCKNKI